MPTSQKKAKERKKEDKSKFVRWKLSDLGRLTVENLTTSLKNKVLASKKRGRFHNVWSDRKTESLRIQRRNRARNKVIATTPQKTV